MKQIRVEMDSDFVQVFNEENEAIECNSINFDKDERGVYVELNKEKYYSVGNDTFVK